MRVCSGAASRTLNPPPTHAAQAAPPGGPAAAPLQSLELRIELTDDDRPEDRFSHHVNNARYFAFINRTFQAWYRPMGLRDPGAPFSAVMAHVSWDFLRQVMVPGAVLCRITVVKAGRTSLEHQVEILDLGSEPPAVAGRGRVVHVGIEPASGRSTPWPAEILARCWAGDRGRPPGG